MTGIWIDTHCHLDAPEFDSDREQVCAAAQAAQVGLCVIPAVSAPTWDAVRQLAHRSGNAYALGIHPLYTANAQESDLAVLARCLEAHGSDARLVALGEIGLDYFVPLEPGRQEWFFREQVRLAKQHQLPVILHVRRSVDKVLQCLRELHFAHGGIAHAFNGSAQQAKMFLDRGFKLGFGGAMTFERARQLQRLAQQLPADAIVMETDAPDMPPDWLYVPAHLRGQGQAQGRNAPDQLPRIAAMLAQLRGVDLQAWRTITTDNACVALPRLRALLAQPAP